MIKIKTLTTTLVLALLASAGATTAQADDLYLILGQSNAAGRDTNIKSGGADKSTYLVQLFNSAGTFEQAKQPLNQYSDIKKAGQDQGVNLGLEFGIEMAEYHGNKVYLVVNARGGTKAAQWKDGNSTGYFDATVARVIDAQAACGCKLKGIVWHQGEGDIRGSTGAPSYYWATMADVVEDYRGALGDVPFLVGQLYQGESDNADFNSDIKQVDDASFEVDNVDWVSTKNFTTLNNDGVHFDASSMRKLGRKYAARMQEYVD